MLKSNVMNMMKEIQVIMLPTEKESKLLLNEDYLELLPSLSKQKPNTNRLKLQHLYFLSDEEIKEGDWCWNQYKGSVEACIGKVGKTWHKSMKKIIATTDLELTIDVKANPNHTDAVKVNLPRPSNSFLQKYVEEYNKGNVIEKVLVEYEQMFRKAGDNDTIKDNPLVIKVAPDNTITIKPVNSKEKQHLQWIYNRMIQVHKEDPDVDYMLAFRDILKELK